MNRKKRNLIFIRNKNKLRKGLSNYYLSQKISTDISEDYINIVYNNLKKEILKDLKRKFNINPLDYVNLKIDLSIGLCDWDFVRNTRTIKLTLNLLGKL